MFKLPNWVRLVGLSLAALTLTLACTQTPKSTSPIASSTPDSKPLITAISEWIGHSTYYVADRQGFFKEAGVNTQNLFVKSSSETITAFMTEKADIAWMTTADAVQMAEKEPSLKIIYALDYSNGSDTIIGRNIKSPQDLKGKNVARENALFERILLQAYLNKAGLTENDVKIQDMVAADAATHFATKKVDVAVTYEPHSDKALKQGGGAVIFSTKDTNLIADAIVVRQSLIQTRKAELQTYLKAVDKAAKLVKAGNPEALKIIADTLHVSVEQVKPQISGVKLFDLADNKAIAFNKGNSNSVISNLELTAKAAKEFKLVSKVIDPTLIHDSSIVDSI